LVILAAIVSGYLYLNSNIIPKKDIQNNLTDNLSDNRILIGISEWVGSISGSGKERFFCRRGFKRQDCYFP